MNPLLLLLVVLVGYLLGSVNTSLVVGKWLYKTDIREHGSGNAGATNALRTLGKKAAIMAIIGDGLKGVLACLFGRLLLGETAEGVYAGAYIGGMMSVIGHNWPVFFGFKGGKGVMTSFAVILTLAPFPALICGLVFIVLVAVWRMVSLGSIVAATCFPLVVALMGAPLLLVLVGVFIALLINIRHLGNIQRILSGTEKKLSFGKKA